MRLSSPLAVAALAVPLAACASSPGVVPPGQAAYVSSVEVSAAPGASPSFAPMVQSRTTQHAARLGRAGAPKDLGIVVDRITYKNPALSLMIGDANRVVGRLTVTDVASGRAEGHVEVVAGDAAGAGAIGAIGAAVQDRRKADEPLADAFAKAVLRAALGSAVVDPVLYRDDPIIYMPPARHVIPEPAGKVEPTPAAQPAAKPTGEPKTRPAPVAATSQTAAMAAIPAAVAR